MLYLIKKIKIFIDVVVLFLFMLLCIFFEIVGDIARIVRNLQNMEDSILGPNPTRHFNLDNIVFDVVDNNDNTH